MTEYLLDVFMDENITRRFSLCKHSWDELRDYQAYHRKTWNQVKLPIGISWALTDRGNNILYLDLTKSFGIKLWTRNCDPNSNPFNNPDIYEDPLH